MYDVRVVIIESTVLSTGKLTELEFKTKALLPLTQNIPLVSVHALMFHLYIQLCMYIRTIRSIQVLLTGPWLLH